MQSRGSSSDGTPPNFRTTLDGTILLRGFSRRVASIYEPSKFYDRAWRSLQNWESKNWQHPAQEPTTGGILRILAGSIWQQGFRSSYRKYYWKFFAKIFGRYALNPPKRWLAFTILISGHHFTPYASELVEKVEREVLNVRPVPELVAAPVGD